MTDQEILVELLEKHEAKLSENEVEAFEHMLGCIEGKRRLTDRQRSWIYTTAERLGVTTPPPENLFSSLSPEAQREHRRRARAVELPWEKPGAQKALKPPGRA
jgi:hypothetical protein